MLLCLPGGLVVFLSVFFERTLNLVQVFTDSHLHRKLWIFFLKQSISQNIPKSFLCAWAVFFFAVLERFLQPTHSKCVRQFVCLSVCKVQERFQSKRVFYIEKLISYLAEIILAAHGLEELSPRCLRKVPPAHVLLVLWSTSKT